jgi:hypothetical protein
MSSPAAYLIRVSGWLDPSWTEHFDYLAVTVSAPIGQTPETTLCGQVPDQAALIGILHELHDLGVTVLVVERLSTPG